MDAKERFYKHVRKTADCWLWIGAKDWGGYGHVKVGGVLLSAHRRSYELEHGSIPTGMHVLHTCDNPSCVNPAHLYLGTHQDNMRDIAKRQRAYRGDCSPRFTQDQIEKIRNSDLSQHALAKKYKVDLATIRAALGLRKA